MIRHMHGDCRQRLMELDAQSVHCVVTSPPYWGLRKYGDHRAGTIGLERSFDAWLMGMLDVFAKVWDVLRDDGVLWLNMGDAYVAQAGGTQGTTGQRARRRHTQQDYGLTDRGTNLARKQLMGQPWRLALALQEQGWILRADCIWDKPNAMPEGVHDRPTKSHEYVFLLTKRPRYFYDAEAVREAHTEPWRGNGEADRQNWNTGGIIGRSRVSEYTNGTRQYNPAGRNKRTVWSIPTQPYSAAHFATFPSALIEPCIKAGTSLHGCCAACGAPWRRMVERRSPEEYSGKDLRWGNSGNGQCMPQKWDTITTTTGWAPTCPCDAGLVPATVLDCFGGAGPTALVADRLGRHAINIDITQEYIDQSQERIASEAPLLAQQYDGNIPPDEYWQQAVLIPTEPSYKPGSREYDKAQTAE